MFIVKKILCAETDSERNCRPDTNGWGARSPKGQRWGKVLAYKSVFANLNDCMLVFMEMEYCVRG
jgi:hypothetical protein